MAGFNPNPKRESFNMFEEAEAPSFQKRLSFGFLVLCLFALVRTMMILRGLMIVPIPLVDDGLRYVIEESTTFYERTFEPGYH